MALANFFDKSALAASQILTNYDRSDFERNLNESPVEVAYDHAAVSSAEGKATLEMTMNLLARLYPKVIITEIGMGESTHKKVLEAIALSINPLIDIYEEKPCVTISVGNTAVERDTPVFYLGSDNWTVNFSDSNPVGSGLSENPFAAGAAACYGAANIFRHVFKDQLKNSQSDSFFSLSLLDYKTGQDTKNGDNGPIGQKVITLTETALVGLGAIGNGVVWALSKIPLLEGTLHLIDPEEIELSNLQRYVLAGQEHLGIHKTDLAMTKFATSGLTLVPHQGDWASFLNNRNSWKMDIAIVAVDSAEHRINIQASLPRVIINGWTQSDDLGISRHFDFEGDACLACLYPPAPGIKPASVLISESLGLPHEEFDIRQMVYNNDIVDEGWIKKIAEAKSFPEELLRPYVNAPIRDFYSKVICGGIMLGEVHKQAETPMAFQSALAGILLAAELIIKNEHLRPEPIDNVTKLDLLHPVKEFLSEMVIKPHVTKCICQDEDFLSQYQTKYPNKNLDK